jgi:hypothetical protein
MRPGSLFGVLVFLLAGCPGGGGAIGDVCGGNDDCGGTLQCVEHVCVPRCQRAPECGDGYACDQDGFCRLATGQRGDTCQSEVDCAPGLACRLDGKTVDPGTHLLTASCDDDNSGRPAGAPCQSDGQCRNNTCALGHCLDLCRETRDCGAGTGCTAVPRVEVKDVMPTPKFAGCLQSRGSLSWTLPVHGPDETVLLPIPDTARSVSVTMTVDDPNQRVGAAYVFDPDGKKLVDTDEDETDPELFYTRSVRHRLGLAESVLAMPASPEAPLAPGAYTLRIQSRRVPTGAGTATPSATAVVKLDSSATLDLHFYFLNLDEHPCGAAFNDKLDAQTATTATFFQDGFLKELRGEFEHAGISLGTTTYEDLRSHPELDGLDVADAGALMSLGAHAGGINVFFVRSLSPVGLQAISPNPGPAGVGGTRQSGVIISLDTLCYRQWSQLARLTAHELARYMGLYDNIDLDGVHTDPIADSDMSNANLMFYSELGGTDLSSGQRQILGRSPVLR